jgi:hypothetical protein
MACLVGYRVGYIEAIMVYYAQYRGGNFPFGWNPKILELQDSEWPVLFVLQPIKRLK